MGRQSTTVGFRAEGIRDGVADRNTPAGGDCSQDDNACGDGLACFADVCRSWCDPQADDCMVGTCTDVGAAFYLPVGTVGVCM